MIFKAGFALDLPDPVWARVAAACPAGIEVVRVPSDWRDLAALRNLDALVVGTQALPETAIAAAPKLRLVQRWGTGLDNIDAAALRARGIAVAELPGVNARSVSEFLLLAILALLRHLPDTVVAWAGGAWGAGRADVPPRRLTGKTVGLLGYGAIGRDLARLLAPFEATVLFHDLRAPERADSGAVGPLGKDEILRRSDVVCVSLPLNDGTRGAVGAPELARMKPSAILVSVARSEVVDEAAVRQAVREGRLAAASFDNFPQEPLPGGAMFHAPGILATPHMGGGTIDGFEALARACFANIASVLGAHA